MEGRLVKKKKKIILFFVNIQMMKSYRKGMSTDTLQLTEKSKFLQIKLNYLRSIKIVVVVVSSSSSRSINFLNCLNL